MASQHQQLFKLITGPFYMEADIGCALALHSMKSWERNKPRPLTPEFFARYLSEEFSGYGRGVLAHADLQCRNILLEPLSEDETSPDSWPSGERRVSAVLDWEDAGWYPSSWEYAAVFADLQWIDGWAEKVEHMLGPCILEAALLKIVRFY